MRLTSKLVLIFFTVGFCYLLSIAFQNKTVVLDASSIYKFTQSEGKFKVGIQAGHWKNSELPNELIKLRDEATGAQVGSVNEWEVTLEVAQKVKAKLDEQGIDAEVLPSTIPIDYKADAFVAIHADGNDDTSVNGYKIVASDFDKSGKAGDLASFISKSYATTTKFSNDFNNITPEMAKYYVFNNFKFNHSVNPETPAVILELGFITNKNERSVMVKNPDLLAKGIVEGILELKKSLGR